MRVLLFRSAETAGGHRALPARGQPNGQPPQAAAAAVAARNRPAGPLPNGAGGQRNQAPAAPRAAAAAQQQQPGQGRNGWRPAAAAAAGRGAVGPAGPGPGLPVCPMHGVPVRVFTTRKEGPNQGREFFKCAQQGEGCVGSTGNWVWRDEWEANPGPLPAAPQQPRPGPNIGNGRMVNAIGAWACTALDSIWGGITQPNRPSRSRALTH